MGITRLTILFFAISLAFLTSCNSKYSMLTQYTSFNPSGKISGKLVNLSIHDKRTNVENRKMNIPLLTFLGNYDKMSPAITEYQKRKIDSIYRTYFENSPNEIEMKINLVQGEKEFKANALNEQENVYVQINLEMKNKETLKEYSVTSNIIFNFKSMDASQEFLDAAYDVAIIAAIRQSMELLFVEMKK